MGAGYTSIVSSVFPALGALLSSIFLKEKMKGYQIAGLVVSLLGVIALIVAVGVYLLFSAIFYFIPGVGNAKEQFFTILAAMITVGVFPMALMLPLNIRFGMEKARVYLIFFIIMEKIIIGIQSALDIISNFLFYYHFIHSHSYLSEQAPVSVADVTYSQQQAKHWFLF